MSASQAEKRYRARLVFQMAMRFPRTGRVLVRVEQEYPRSTHARSTRCREASERALQQDVAIPDQYWVYRAESEERKQAPA
jgi:hypothetical protein